MQLTLIELTNSSQFFGKSEYAMFLATTPDNQIVELGITHNSLQRKGYDTDNLVELADTGCSVVTKPYTDNQTGEIINPEDRVQMILDGDARLVLFNSINHSIKTSELYRTAKRELTSSTNAKVKVEMEKERKQSKLQASIERVRAKALASMLEKPATPESLDDSDDAPAVEQPANTEDIADGIEF
jgi:hypothetical protein